MTFPTSQAHTADGLSARRIAGIALASVAVLGATALYVRRQADRAERAHPPLGRFVEVDGVRLHYVEKGKGPPVVLLHGNGAMIDDFMISGLLDRASESYRVVAFDRPGYGHSDRPKDRRWTPEAQAELLRRAFALLGIEHPVVVGHSWGTLVALALALDEPATVRGLVLMSGYYFETARADVPIIASPAIPILGDVMRYTVSPLIDRMIAPRLYKKIFAPRPVPARFAASFPLDMAVRPSQIRASAEEAAFMIPAAASFQSRYRDLSVPVVILAGAQDQIVDVGLQSVRLHQELPWSKLHVEPGLGHMIHYFMSDRVMDAIATASRRGAGTRRSSTAGN